MMIAAAAISFAACGGDGTEDPTPAQKTKLETPVVTLDVSEPYTLVVNWEAVNGADSYRINMKGKNYTTTETTYTFENLNAGEYQVRVQAIGEGYLDSEFGSASATVVAPTSVAWFEQTFTLPEQDDPENGVYRCNTADFTWKGTGVTDLLYGIWSTEALVGADDATIIANLEAPSGVNEILDEINGDGFYGQFTAMLAGGTSYTLCVQVTNSEGVKFFTKNEVTTEEAEASEAAKAWVGTWEVTSHKIYTIDDQGNGTSSDKEEKFTITIETSTSNPDEVYVYNYTMLGADAWPAVGMVNGTDLYLMNGVNLGASNDGSYYYYWLGWYDFGDGKISPSIDELPFAVVTMGEGNTTATYYNEFELYDQNNNPVPVVCYAADIFGVSSQGAIYFLGIESFPANFRSGQMEWVKVDAAASAQALNADFAPAALKSNVVVR